MDQAVREEIALALLLWKDFKSDGKLDPKITMSMLQLADALGVMTEVDDLMGKLPPMKVVPRYGT